MVRNPSSKNLRYWSMVIWKKAKAPPALVTALTILSKIPITNPVAVKSISNIDVPGTGFGLGFDRTLEALEEFNLIPNLKTNSKVLVTVFSESLLNESIKALKILRKNNINTELYPDPNTKLDKQLKYADKKGIPYVIIIGRDEVDNNIVTLKNLQTNEQKKVTISKVCELLQG